MSYKKHLFSSLILSIILFLSAHAQVVPPSSQNLLARFAFEEGSGNTASDSSGNGNTATLRNNPSWVTRLTGNRALSFNGVNQWAEIGYKTSGFFRLQVDHVDASVAAWIKPNSLTAWQPIYQIGGCGNSMVIGLTNSGAVRFAVRKSGVQRFIDSPVLAPSQVGQWLHVAGVNSSSGTTVYINGIASASVAGAFTWNTGANFNAIGTSGNTESALQPASCSGAIEYFNGAIDELRIYDYALSASEVSTIAGVVSPPPTDTTPPTISLTTPTAGSTVSGTTVSITATATDPTIAGQTASGVAGVTFFVDGTQVGTEDTTAPYTTTWNSTLSTNASHSLTARARDGAGLTTTSAGVTVTVNNVVPPTTTACDAPITIPAGGGTVTGTTAGASTLKSSSAAGCTATISTATNIAPEKVYTWTPTTSGTATINTCNATGTTFDTVLYLRNANSCPLNTSDLSCNDDTTGCSAGGSTDRGSRITPTVTAGTTYYIVVDGYNPSGGGYQGNFSLTVTAPAGGTTDPTPPTVSISQPTNGSTVSGNTTITATANDNVGVTKVEFFTELGKLGETLTAPFSFAWNTLTTSNGSHTLTSKAWDAALNNTTSAGVNVNVSNVASGPATYYVDDLDSTCSTTNPGLGTLADPYKNLNYATQHLNCGDTLYIRGGTYRNDVAGYGNTLCKPGAGGYPLAYFTQQCTSANPITIRPYNNETVILDGTSIQIDDATGSFGTDGHWKQCESATQCGAATGLALQNYQRTYYSDIWNFGSSRTEQMWIDPACNDADAGCSNPSDTGTRLAFKYQSAVPTDANLLTGACNNAWSSPSCGSFITYGPGDAFQNSAIIARLPDLVSNPDPDNHIVKIACQAGTCAANLILFNAASNINILGGSSMYLKYGYESIEFANAASNIIIDGVKIHAAGGRDYGQCVRTGNGNNVTVRNSVCSESASEGIAFYGGGNGSCIQVHDNIAENNTVYNTGFASSLNGAGNVLDDGIIIKSCNNCTARGNTIYDAGRQGVKVTANWNSGGTCSSNNATIEQNKISHTCNSISQYMNGDCAAIQVTGAGGIYGSINNTTIRNNIVFDNTGLRSDIKPAGIKIDGGVGSTIVANNSLRNIATACLDTIENSVGVGNFKVYNNALYQCNAGLVGGAAYVKLNLLTDWTRSNNTYWGDTNGVAVLYRNSSGGSINILRDQIVSQFEATAIQQNPQYVSASDLHLSNLSPLINKGADLLASLGFNNDIDNNSSYPRPQGTAWDIGADEVVGGTTPTDTTPPAVSISTPGAGSTVSGTAVSIAATASDPTIAGQTTSGVAGVTFFVDGTQVGTEDTTAPYTTTWNSTLSTNASHSLTARARDGAGLTTTSAGVTVTVNNVVADTTAPVLTNITSSNITTNSATITWTTNENATSQVEYGFTTAYGASTPLNASLSTTHSTSLTGLSPNTTYNYRVISKDSSNNTATSLNRTFTTQSLPDTQAPATISNLSVTATTQTSLTLSWTAPQDVPSGQVASYDIRYSTSPLSASSWSTATQVTGEPTPATPGTTQTYTLTGLQAGTTYQIAIKSQDSIPNISLISNVVVQATQTPPPVFNFTISNGGNRTVTQGSSVTNTISTALLSGTTQAVTFTTGTLPTGVTAVFAPTNCNPTCSTTLTLSTLSSTPVGSYSVTVIGTGGSVVKTTSFTFGVTAPVIPPPPPPPPPPSGDTTEPAISDISVTKISASTVIVKWTTNEPATSQVEYGKTTSYGTMTPLDSSLLTTHSVTITGLSRKTTYHYRIRTRDATGNEALSGDFTLTTSAKPPKVTSVSASSGSIILSWTSPTDYEFYRGVIVMKNQGTYTEIPDSAQAIANTTADTFRDTNVTPSTTYYYSFFVYDDEGNYSDPEYISYATASATTPPPSGGGGGGGGGGGTIFDTTPPRKPSNLRVFGGPDQIILDWSNPRDTDFVRNILVRKEGSVPTSRIDGTQIYEGTGTEFTDTKAQSGKTYYYSLFSFDQNNNFSTPAISSSFLGKNTEAEIVELKSQKPLDVVPPPPSTTQGIIITRYLSRGSKHSEVRTLQTYLQTLGYLQAEPTGYFGVFTEQALKSYQTANNLEPVGGTGPKTRALLRGSPPAGGSTPLPPPTPVPPTSKTTITKWLTQGSEGSEVTTLQTILKQKGYFTEEPTGYFGPKTRQALQKFQCDVLQVCSGSVDETGWGATGPRTRGAL